MLSIDAWDLLHHSLFDKINTLKKEKVENLNQIFSEVRRDMQNISKSTAKESTGKTLVMCFIMTLHDIIALCDIQ